MSDNPRVKTSYVALTITSIITICADLDHIFPSTSNADLGMSNT